MSSDELTTWREHFELMVTSITNPDTVAEEACRVNIISSEAKTIVQRGRYGSIKDKSFSLLKYIEDTVKRQPFAFHQFRLVLVFIPGLASLAHCLLSSYSRFMLSLSQVPVNLFH